MFSKIQQRSELDTLRKIEIPAHRRIFLAMYSFILHLLRIVLEFLCRCTVRNHVRKTDVQQQFPFLQLPRELRDQIYSYAVVSNLKLFHIERGVLLRRRHAQREVLFNLAVLHINKQIRREALLVYFAQNTVAVWLPGCLRDWTEQLSSKVMWSKSPKDGVWTQWIKKVPTTPSAFIDPFRFGRIYVYLELSAYSIRQNDYDVSNHWVVLLRDLTQKLLARRRMVEELTIHVWNSGKIPDQHQLSGYNRMFEPLLMLNSVRRIQFEINEWQCSRGAELVEALKEQGKKAKEVLENAWRTGTT